MLMGLPEDKKKYTCPLYELKDIPIPEIDTENPPEILVNCKEIKNTDGDYLCHGKVPIYRTTCHLRKFPCCICTIPTVFYVPCPCCGEGNTYVFERKATGEILMCCEECDHVWRQGQENMDLEIDVEPNDNATLLGFLMRKEKL